MFLKQVFMAAAPIGSMVVRGQFEPGPPDSSEGAIKPNANGHVRIPDGDTSVYIPAHQIICCSAVPRRALSPYPVVCWHSTKYYMCMLGLFSYRRVPCAKNSGRSLFRPASGPSVTTRSLCWVSRRSRPNPAVGSKPSACG